MHSVTLSLLPVLALITPSLSVPNAGNAKLATRSVCKGNTASTRSQWCDFNIDTDYTTIAPDTGVTREYWLELTDPILAPDGRSRYTQVINGTVPGPTLYADWGDTVKIHYTNKLSNSTNGTSIHFHGIRQNFTNSHDGVVSITQCPTAKGSSYTYTWKAVQYGTSWYHSHFGLQAFEGAFGGIVINGPATANYDEDLGTISLVDWDKQTADYWWSYSQTQAQPSMDNALINGTNTFGQEGAAGTTGKRFTTKFEAGKSYRMRLINAAVDTHFKFSIDNHDLQVIATDLVPIKPFNTSVLSIAMGQRYDIIVQANQQAAGKSFWMRAKPQSTCSKNTNADNIKGILYYGDSTAVPTTSSYTYPDNCDDMPASQLVPHVAKNVGSSTYEQVHNVSISKNDQKLWRWYLNSTSLKLDWGNPTLVQIQNQMTNYAASDAVFQLEKADEWAYTVIETNFPVAHPIHLHGHDYFILAQGTGAYNSSVHFNTKNPARRDTAMLPAAGYLVIAFQTDNPGAWLMHCHIGWHAEQGFALQFVERQSEIPSVTDTSLLNDNCNAWASYNSAINVFQDDSGI
ncbi:multicopper oxidase [Apiospora rasikravindrae]|uniref:Multicopper oxidase n=1 Tax=Apiospora rasikravindrae TaxID=990691 RepID=A0ABR1SLB6_9PEZI